MRRKDVDKLEAAAGVVIAAGPRMLAQCTDRHIAKVARMLDAAKAKAWRGGRVALAEKFAAAGYLYRGEATRRERLVLR